LAEHPELRSSQKSPWGQRKIETAVNQFLSRPEYRGDSKSATLMIEEIQKTNEPVSTQLLYAIFNRLVDEGKIKPNTDAVARVPGFRYTNYT
jgi:hypothetical protein